MTSAQKGILMLQDEAGAYYILPQDLLEQSRVPAEHTAEAERVFAAARADDVTGHLSLNFTKITFKRGFVGTLIDENTTIGTMFQNNAVGGVFGPDAAAQFRGRMR